MDGLVNSGNKYRLQFNCVTEPIDSMTTHMQLKDIGLERHPNSRWIDEMCPIFFFFFWKLYFRSHWCHLVWCFLILIFIFPDWLGRSNQYLIFVFSTIWNVKWEFWFCSSMSSGLSRKAESVFYCSLLCGFSFLKPIWNCFSTEISRLSTYLNRRKPYAWPKGLAKLTTIGGFNDDLLQRNIHLYTSSTATTIKQSNNKNSSNTRSFWRPLLVFDHMNAIMHARSYSSILLFNVILYADYWTFFFSLYISGYSIDYCCCCCIYV